MGAGLGKDIALITDGRFSGGSHGFIIGHITPEAQQCKIIIQISIIVLACPLTKEKPELFTHISIDCFAGRSLDAKRNLYRNIVQNLEQFGIPKGHVKILLREITPENWGFVADKQHVMWNWDLKLMFNKIAIIFPTMFVFCQNLAL